MASIQQRNIVVLTPNGRRQIVNVTLNSTVLQILEEVCKQHNFDPLEYDLRHHNNILDTTMTVQFSRLPNNAMLEMVKAKKIRKESEVIVNVQVESGDRLSGTFLPSASLWDVVKKLCPNCVTTKVPAIVYMRQEVCGMENLQMTSLRSLGLTSGRALLRFMCKTVEGEIPKQTAVTSKLANYGIASSSKAKDSIKADISPQPVKKDVVKERVDRDFDVRMGSGTDSKTVSRTSQPLAKGKELSDRSGQKSVSHEGSSKVNSSQDNSMKAGVSANKKKETDKSPSPVGYDVKYEDTNIVSQKNAVNDSLEDIFKAEIKPRDRNPVIFRQGSHKSSVGNDLPDEFFELTLNDVQNLYKDLKTKTAEMNEAPLQTSAVKKLEESKRILNNLHKYKRTVLRIQFPDQIILQGSFSPVETVESVHEFVRGYLQDPSLSFYLFTTPPKTILTPTSRLIEINCVPCALLHFGVPDDAQESKVYVRSEALNELTTPEVASAAATQSRGLRATSEQHSIPSTSGLQQAQVSLGGTHTSKQSQSSRNSPSDSKNSKSVGNPNGKVPKWFKVGPK